MTTALFGPLMIQFNEDVLAPRAWTYAQSRWAAELADSAPSGRILELYCGAGHVGLAAATLSDRDVLQIDVDEAACRCAVRNATASGVMVDVRHEAIDASLDLGHDFPLVIAEPPYLPDELDRYSDPPCALDGDDGLEQIRACLAAGARHLMPGAPLLLQTHGLAHVAEVEREIGDLESSLMLEEVRAFGPDKSVALLRAGT